MGFSFSAEQRDRLLASLGRSDSGAWHLTEDVELAVDAYGRVELSADALGRSGVVALLSRTRELTASLRQELYALPERARELAALGEIDDSDAEDLTRLAHASGEVLERLGVRMAQLMVPQSAPAHGPHAMAERFVGALGQAYRNRLNIKPTSDGKGAFRRFLDGVIEMVRKRHADLDEFAQLLTEARLAEILARDH